MVRPDQDPIGGRPGDHVEVDETCAVVHSLLKNLIFHYKILISISLYFHKHKPHTNLYNPKRRLYTSLFLLAILPDRSAKSLCFFVACAVMPRTSLLTHDCSIYANLSKRLYKHLASPN